MIRLSFYIFLALSLALGAAWIADHPGQLVMRWQDWEMHLTLSVFCALIILYTVCLWLLVRLLRYLRGGGPWNSLRRRDARRTKGQGFLNRAASALALGDKAAALRLGKKAKSALGPEGSVLRLLAEVSEDKERDGFLDQLAQSADTADWALKHQLELSLGEQDWQKALELTRTLHGTNETNISLTRHLIDLQARLDRWPDAAETLSKSAKHLGAKEASHLDAVLTFCRARESDAAGHRTEALELARKALKKDPAFTPAALLAARLLQKLGDSSGLKKLLEKSWKAAPRPELGQLMIDFNPMESATERYRRIGGIVGRTATDKVTLHLLSALAMEAEHWPEARRALDDIVNAGTADKETYRLLARLDQKQKKGPGQKYLDLANTAPPTAHWHCQDCASTPGQYSPLCQNCGAFDSLHWTNNA